jgi:hypothetical protein
MKAYQALLIGCAIVAAAALTGHLLDSPQIFWRICEWVVLINAVFAVLLFAYRERTHRRRRVLPPFLRIFFQPAEAADLLLHYYLSKEEFGGVGHIGDVQEEPEIMKQQTTREQNIKYGIGFLLIALPCLIAVLVHYYLL